MYRQFCKNLNNFIYINELDNEPENLRLKNAKDILLLTDVKNFLKFKDTDAVKYQKIGNFIFELSKFKQSYPTLEKFLWELWAYGFDSVPYEENGIKVDEFLEEKVKLIDLMLSTHYF
jgi:hypothetical protein